MSSVTAAKRPANLCETETKRTKFDHKEVIQTMDVDPKGDGLITLLSADSSRALCHVRVNIALLDAISEIFANTLSWAGDDEKTPKLCSMNIARVRAAIDMFFLIHHRPEKVVHTTHRDIIDLFHICHQFKIVDNLQHFFRTHIQRPKTNFREVEYCMIAATAKLEYEFVKYSKSILIETEQSIRQNCDAGIVGLMPKGTLSTVLNHRQRARLQNYTAAKQFFKSTTTQPCENSKRRTGEWVSMLSEKVFVDDLMEDQPLFDLRGFLKSPDFTTRTLLLLQSQKCSQRCSNCHTDVKDIIKKVATTATLSAARRLCYSHFQERRICLESHRRQESSWM